MEGELKDGVFSGNNVRIEGLTGPNGPVTLGFRAEDAHVAEAGSGEINASVYTMELLGDATMITVRAGGALVSVKAHKEFRAEIDDPVSIAVPTGICHLFDKDSGARIGGH
jgi:multiple sugar transport system ATP-binding protein